MPKLKTNRGAAKRFKKLLKVVLNEHSRIADIYLQKKH